MAAMDMMTTLLRGQPVETKRLSAELIERKSTAPPKAAAPTVAPKSHE
jgi:DNA-binding LacI/PurR family transcriptional regulator